MRYPVAADKLHYVAAEFRTSTAVLCCGPRPLGDFILTTWPADMRRGRCSAPAALATIPAAPRVAY